MEKFKKLCAACKNSVMISVNDHRDVYETVVEHLGDNIENIPEDIASEMVLTDTIVQVQFYPRTSIGYYCIWHYDIDMAMDEALKALEQDK